MYPELSLKHSITHGSHGGGGAARRIYARHSTLYNLVADLFVVVVFLCLFVQQTITATVAPPAPPADEQLKRIYLARGLKGRIDCSLRADPPYTMIVWTKDAEPLDISTTAAISGSPGERRVNLTPQGTLVFQSVMAADEGRYACVTYSPLEIGKSSVNFNVLVRGEK